MKKHVWIMNHYAGSMYFNNGGRHYYFAKYMRQAGYEPVIFCCNAKHGSPEHFFNIHGLWQEHPAEEIGVPWVFVKARTYTGNGKQRILNMVDFYLNVKKTAREYAAEHGKPDVIYASSVHPLTLVAGLRLAKHFGVECVCEVRDLWPESLMAYGVVGPHHPGVIALRRLEKWIYQKADSLIFTMEGGYDYIVEQGWEKDVPRSKVFHINNGVDLETFNYNREHYQIEDPDLDDPDICKVVYAGSVRRVNNLGLILDAAKAVSNPRIKFLIWGGGDERPALERRLVDEHIENVVFKGYVEKTYVPYIVSQADINLIHSGEAGVPLMRFGISLNKMFDCFAAEKLTLMDLPAKYNPLVTWEAGIVVDGAKEIPEGIERTQALSEEEWAALRENARRAAEEYDFKNLAQQLIKVLEV